MNIDKIIEERVQQYGKYYEGILPVESIEESKAFWRAELTTLATEVENMVLERVGNWCEEQLDKPFTNRRKALKKLTRLSEKYGIM